MSALLEHGPNGETSWAFEKRWATDEARARPLFGLPRGAGPTIKPGMAETFSRSFEMRRQNALNAAEVNAMQHHFQQLGLMQGLAAKQSGDCIANEPLASQVGGIHYKEMAIQPAEYCQRNRLGFLESNVIKYVSRHRAKHGREDIEKAIHCLQLLLEIDYPE